MPSSSVRSRYYHRLLEAVSLSKLWTYMPVLLGIEAFTGFAAYRLEYNRRKAFLLDYQVEKTRKRQTEILHTMLPAFVVEHMLNGPFNRNGVPVGLKAEDRGTVSVVFCDVYDFQNIVASVAPTHLVKVLDSLFLCFDKCAERFGCTKIETVFETYLAAAGIKLDNCALGNTESAVTPSDNAFDALCMALIMLRFSRHVTYVVTETGGAEHRSGGAEHRAFSSDCTSEFGTGGLDADNAAHHDVDAAAITLRGQYRPRRSHDVRHKKVRRIRVKIGIHSGRVISGVVGAKKPQYALFGDTVNTASRMKTTGKPDHIHVSSATHDLVKADGCLVWEQRLIQVKGKGAMTTYLLIRVELPPATAAQKAHTHGHAPASLSRSLVLPPEPQFKEMPGSPPHSFNGQPQTVTFETATPSVGDSPCEADPAAASTVDPLMDDVKDLDEELQAVRVESLWARFQRLPSRERLEGSRGPSPAPTNDAHPHVERSYNGSNSHKPRKSEIAETAVEETVFRTCLRRMRRRITKEPALKSAPSDVWKSKSARRITSEVHWVSLTFKSPELEDRYKMHYYSNPSNINNIEQAIMIFIATYVIQTLVFIAIPRYERLATLDNESGVTWAMRMVFVGAAFGLWLILHLRDRVDLTHRIGIKSIVYFANFTFIAAACAGMLEASWSLDFPEDVKPIWLHVDTLQLFFFITILHHNSGLLVQHVVLFNCVVMIISICFITSVTQSTPITTEALILIPLFVVANVFSVFFKEFVDRQSFIVNEDMQEMQDRGKELLRDMLPKEVLEELQQDNLKLAYKHERITFIFADICGFTTWADTVDASEVVTVLQSLFAKFDRDSTRFGVFKVCTIGDAYVAVSEPATEQTMSQGLYNPATGAERVLAMAQCMIRDIKGVREKLNIPSLNMRIGLHFGSCVGGVIGSGRLRYDLWGLDVLTGNLMESNGVPGKVCMSQQLVDFLDMQFPGRFHFQFHKSVEVTNMIVNAYLLLTERVGGSDELLRSLSTVPELTPICDRASEHKKYFLGTVGPAHQNSICRGGGLDKVRDIIR